MRIVFTVRAASGHFHPLVPLAQAAGDAGHEAVFATPAPFQSMVEHLGFRWLKAGLDEASPEYARFIEERNRLSPPESTRFHRRGLVSVLAPHVVADLLRIAETWRPDLVVWDYADFGGGVAAEGLGIPHVSHEAGATFDDLASELVAPLADLRAAYSLPPDPELQMLERYLVLSPFPPSLQGADTVARSTRHCYRATPFDRSGDEGAPEWTLPIPDAPLVYASLGTAFNTRTALLRTFVEALRDERVNLVVTVGRDGDPGQFGSQPPNVRIEQYIPLTLLFPRCDLVISHGGSNTMMAALAHSIPQVMVPIGADQPYNAARCSAAGVARVVLASDATAASIRAAALSVLADPSYRRAARRIHDEMETLPGPDDLVMLLERLAREKAPLLKLT